MSFQAYLDNIEEKTGLTPRQFIELCPDDGYDSPRRRLAFVCGPNA